MEKIFIQISEIIFSILKYILILLTIIMTVIITANIIGRYFLDSSIYWAEEVTRYSFVWATFLGAACAYKKRELVSMSVVVHRMSKVWRRRSELAVSSTIGIFLLIAFVYGIQMSAAVVNQRSASLEISMSYIYICVPISAFCMIIFNITQMITLLKKKKHTLSVWGEDW